MKIGFIIGALILLIVLVRLALRSKDKPSRFEPMHKKFSDDFELEEVDDLSLLEDLGMIPKESSKSKSNPTKEVTAKGDPKKSIKNSKSDSAKPTVTAPKVDTTIEDDDDFLNELWGIDEVEDPSEIQKEEPIQVPKAEEVKEIKEEEPSVSLISDLDYLEEMLEDEESNTDESLEIEEDAEELVEDTQEEVNEEIASTETEQEEEQLNNKTDLVDILSAKKIPLFENIDNAIKGFKLLKETPLATIESSTLDIRYHADQKAEVEITEQGDILLPVRKVYVNGVEAFWDSVEISVSEGDEVEIDTGVRIELPQEARLSIKAIESLEKSNGIKCSAEQLDFADMAGFIMMKGKVIKTGYLSKHKKYVVACIDIVA